MIGQRYQISRTILPAASLDLVTLDQAKTALGITDTSQDAAISQHISQVSAAINNYCDRVFVRQGYRDQFRYVCNWIGAGEPLYARQFPIAVDGAGAPIATVTQDGAVVDATLWEVDADLGRFYAINGLYVDTWTGTAILIDYTGGFDPIPADVQAACLEWLGVQWYSGYGRDPTLSSETIPDLITQSWDAGGGGAANSTAIPAPVEHLLSGYRIWSL